MKLSDENSGFAPHLHTVFQVLSRTYGQTDLTLVAVEDCGTSGIKSLSLIFKGPKDRPLVQKIRRLQHPQMGGFDLFLVPVQLGGQDCIHYQAVINTQAE